MSCERICIWTLLMHARATARTDHTNARDTRTNVGDYIEKLMLLASSIFISSSLASIEQETGKGDTRTRVGCTVEMKDGRGSLG
ncbi:hypothetical protein DFH06DRAFT_1259344 [Mycena polygramma]|nr:hypothetical protein DFH06DRAFT_1259344 [Mycena polygramma]